MNKLFTLTAGIFVLLTVVFFTGQTFGQAVSINSTGNAPNANSILDVSSTTTGALLPRMTTGQRTTLGTSLVGTDEGMTVFDTQLNSYFYWDGASWIRILSANAFSLDAAYDAGTPSSGNGRVIDADAGPVDIQSSSTFSLITDKSVGIGISNPDYRLHVFGNSSGSGEVILGNLEGNGPSGNGATSGLLITGERPGSSDDVGFIQFDNNVGSATNTPLARIHVSKVGNGEMSFRLGDGSGGLTERMVLDNDGILQLDGLTEATSSVVTSTAAGVLQSLPIGSNDDVLKISGGTITWGPATVSTLPLANLGGGANGDVLYHNGSNWVPLSPPGTAAPAGEVYTLTLPNAGSGSPSWSESGDYTSDNLGDHTATQDLDMADNVILDSNDDEVQIGTNATATNLRLWGKLVSDGINETSDGRLKKNVNVIAEALSTVLQLEGVTYNWRTEEYPERSFGERMEYGVIAQQIEKIVPELVNTDSEGYKSVQYSHMVPLLIEAIKEQNELLSKQDSEIAKLKASVESLSDFISTSKK